ncbi:MAG: SprB repeat-containing protein, partial [Bacteroidetes bacterium]|nr:SprB repeat-containing protein [Bacteroidota bacterium]
MKTLYLKTTMKLLRLLPVLIFFMLALSYSARSQYALTNPVCYGKPIELRCSLEGCNYPAATYTWQNRSGSWRVTGYAGKPGILNMDSIINPVIEVGETGYATDFFYLQVQYAPPPQGASGGRVFVTVYPPIVVTGNTTPVSCFGQIPPNGTVTINVSGGTAPYKYQWSNGTTTKDLTGLAAGSYTVTVTDVKLCTKASSTFVVTAPLAALSVTGSSVPVTCTGGPNDGAVNITPDGGSPPYSYLWSNNALTQNLSGVSAGSYTVTVTDSHSCTTTGNWVVAPPSYVYITGEAFPVSCNGYGDGYINTTPTGGTDNFTFLWSNGEVTQNISDLTAGFYTVTVTDNNTCFAIGTYEVTAPAVITVPGSSVGVSCNAGSNGAINITPAGGTAPYTFVWNDAAASTTQNISGLPLGCYSVTVTDSHNCTGFGSFCVTEPSALSVTHSMTKTLCNGSCDGMIDITVTGGTAPYYYIWDNATLSTTTNASGLCAATYTVTITDALGCKLVAGWPVTSPDAIVINGLPVPASCNTYADGSINLTIAGGTGAYSYLWNDPAASTTQNISGLLAGTYTVTVTDANSCKMTGSWTVSQPDGLAWDGSTTNVSCNGLSDGSITTTLASGGTPPYTYLWNNPAASTTPNISGLAAGDYTVTMTDAHGCTTVGQKNITQPSVLAIDPHADITAATCYGGAGGAINITVTGGTTPYSFLWSDPAGSTTQNITGLSAGCFTVTVTDFNLCVTTANFCVGQPDQIVITPNMTKTLCNGSCDGKIDLTVVGGVSPYFFAWSDPAGSTTQNVTGLCAGTFTVTVTDSQGCVMTGSYLVTSPDAIAINGAPYPASCNLFADGGINITVTGGTGAYSFIWNDPAGSTTQNISGLTANTYTVTVTDANSCVKTGSWTVSEPGEVSWYASAINVSCNGQFDGSITTIQTIGGTPPYTYVWNNGETTASITGLSAGRYDITVTDAHSCDALGFREISEPALLAVSPDADITPATCYNSAGGAITITVTGGTLPYTFIWDDPAHSTTQNISNLSSGCYNLTVTDAQACKAYGNFCVSQPDPIVITPSSTKTLCVGSCDGTINITVVGGTSPYFFVWNDPAGSTTQNISGLCAGTYTVTVTDSHNCVMIGSSTVVSADAIVITGEPYPASCNLFADGGINLTVTGGTCSYSFIWNDPAGSTTQNISGLTANVYSVTVTDGNSCVKTGSWTVSEPGEVSWYASAINVSCNGRFDGSITTIQTIGGTPPYTYLWNNGETTSNITGLSAGRYDITVTDSHGCDALGFREISEPALLEISPNADITPATCYNSGGGAISITITGGTMPYTFLWNDPAASTTQNITGLSAGCYSVTVTDSHSCETTANFCVGQPEMLVITPNVTKTLCNGSCDGMIDITVTGGTSPYYYAWSNPAHSTTQNVSGLCAGTYTVTITDAHSCEVIGSWPVTSPDALAVTGEPFPASCNLFADGSINIAVTGGTGAYSFIWNDPAGSTTQNISGLTANTYTVTVTDANSCVKTGTWTVSEPGEVSWYASAV